MNRPTTSPTSITASGRRYRVPRGHRGGVVYAATRCGTCQTPVTDLAGRATGQCPTCTPRPASVLFTVSTATAHTDNHRAVQALAGLAVSEARASGCTVTGALAEAYAAVETWAHLQDVITVTTTGVTTGATTGFEQ
jgi:hypothetical protein